MSGYDRPDPDSTPQLELGPKAERDSAEPFGLSSGVRRAHPSRRKLIVEASPNVLTEKFTLRVSPAMLDQLHALGEDWREFVRDAISEKLKQ